MNNKLKDSLLILKLKEILKIFKVKAVKDPFWELSNKHIGLISLTLVPSCIWVSLHYKHLKLLILCNSIFSKIEFMKLWYIVRLVISQLQLRWGLLMVKVQKVPKTLKTNRKLNKVKVALRVFNLLKFNKY